MSNLIWPDDEEWELWFLDRREEAYRVYSSNVFRHGLMNPINSEIIKPSMKEMEKIFQQSLNSKRRGLEPYVRFRRRRTYKIYQILEDNKKIMGHW